MQRQETPNEQDCETKMGIYSRQTAISSGISLWCFRCLSSCLSKRLWDACCWSGDILETWSEILPLMHAPLSWAYASWPFQAFRSWNHKRQFLLSPLHWWQEQCMAEELSIAWCSSSCCSKDAWDMSRAEPPSTSPSQRDSAKGKHDSEPLTISGHASSRHAQEAWEAKSKSASKSMKGTLSTNGSVPLSGWHPTTYMPATSAP